MKKGERQGDLKYRIFTIIDTIRIFKVVNTQDLAVTLNLSGGFLYRIIKYHAPEINSIKFQQGKHKPILLFFTGEFTEEKQKLAERRYKKYYKIA